MMTMRWSTRGMRCTGDGRTGGQPDWDTLPAGPPVRRSARKRIIAVQRGQ